MTPASAQAEAIHDLYSDVMTVLVSVAAMLIVVFVILFQRPEAGEFSFVSSDRVKNSIFANRSYLAYTHNTLLETI